MAVKGADQKQGRIQLRGERRGKWKSGDVMEDGEEVRFGDCAVGLGLGRQKRESRAERSGSMRGISGEFNG